MKRHNGHERELPYAHIYHALLPIIFVGVWFLDTQFFNLTTILNKYIPFLIRISLFIIILGIALSLIYLSHKILFKSNQPPDTLIRDGIFKYTRNPMYFGIILIYVSLLVFSISLISVAILIGVFLIYNKMVNFEENILEEMFGEEYLDYKTKVPKWILI